MKLQLHFSSILLLLFIFVSVARSYDGVTQVGETGERIVTFVRQTHEDAGFRGAVLAAQDGKVIAAVAVGPLGDEKGEELRVDTLFEIASCTKSITAIAVLKLVEDGQLSLNDSITKHLPGIPDSCQGITVRHLLQHTSGIPGTNTKGSGKDLAKVLPTFLKGGPQNPPGENHEYWNQGYSLLSEVIARASGKTYIQYVREAILNPCKMTSTRFTGQRAPRKASVSIGVSAQGANRSALDHPYGEYGFQYRGMGGLVTNLIDLWRLDRTLASEELLDSKSLEEMTRPGKAGYALGWRIKKIDSGAIVHEHTGKVRGFLASIQRNPSSDGCLFVLANSDSSAPFEMVRQGCENLLEGKDPPVYSKPAADPGLDSSLISELVGTYRDKKGRTFTVSLDGHHAKALINWNGPITYGYLGAADNSDGLLFGTMKNYDSKAFVSADKIILERDESEIVALVLTIVEIKKAIRFARVKK